MSDDKVPFFQGVSPKFTFTFGLIIGIAVISTVAFFVVLVGDLGGESASANSGTAKVVETDTDTADDYVETTTVSVADIDLSSVYIRGNEDAPVTIVEYSDIECSYCASFHGTMQQIMNDYEGDVKWVWKHYPLSFHPEAEPAATAAECAGEQGKFWEYIDELYDNQSSLGSNLYTQIASELSLDTTSFNTCLVADKYTNLFSSDMSEGSALGVSGTPGSIIFRDGDATGEIIAGAYPYEYVAEVIEGLL